MATTVAHLEAKLTANTRDFDRAMSTSDRKMGGASRNIQRAALGIGVAMASGLGVAAKIGWDEFNQGQKVAAQTGAVLKSTGGIANVTAGQVDRLAGSLMKKTGVDDEAIKSGSNMLLTFTKIRNETGKGNDIFNQATKATLDLSVAMGKDMSSSAIMVGKALNDPIRGMSAMGRAGVQFTEAQKETVTAMIESGNQMGAQKIILKELETQFGGSAKAAGQTLGGQINILKERFSNFAGVLVGRAIPHILAVIKFFQEHTTVAKLLGGAVVTLTAGILVLGTALKVHALLTAASTKAMWKFTVALLANPIGLVAAALIGLGLAFVIVWKKSETFRAIVKGALNAVRDAAIWLADKFLWMVDKVLGGIQGMLEGASKIPGIGDRFKGLAEQVGGARAKVQDLRDEIGRLKSKTVRVTAVVRGLGSASALREHISQMQSGDVELPSGPARGSIVGVGKWLQSLGYHVAEHPAFGGVDPVHSPGSFHYIGRAIDVNWPNPAQEPMMLDRIAPLLRGLNPMELLWRTTGHYNHLHLAMDKAGWYNLRPGLNVVGNYTGRPEPVYATGSGGGGGMGPQTIILEADGQQLFRWIRTAEGRYGRRNG